MHLLVKFPVALLAYAAHYGGLGALLLHTAIPTHSHTRANTAGADIFDHLTVPTAIVTVSLLATLASCPWTRLVFHYTPHRPPRCVRLLLDVCLTASLTDALLRGCWLPALDAAFHACQSAAALLAALADGRFAGELRPAVRWLRLDAMRLVRATLALLVVWVMLAVTGVLAHLGARYFEWFGRADGDVAEQWIAGCYSLDECAAQALAAEVPVAQQRGRRPLASGRGCPKPIGRPRSSMRLRAKQRGV